MLKKYNKLCSIIQLFVLVLLCSPVITFAQSLEQTFSKSEIISSNLAYQDFLQKNETLTRQISLGEYGTYDVVLEQTQIFHTGYQGSNLPLTFKGYVENVPNSTVTLTVNDNFLSGSIHTPNREILFEPYRYFSSQAAQDEIIIYDKNDVVSSEAPCLHNHIEQDQTYKNALQNGNLKSVVNDCTEYEAQIFLVADYSMYEEYGSEQAVIDRMTAILNEVQTRYDNEFNAPITFTIVDTYVATCDSDTCDPWTDTVDALELLTEVSTWGGGYATALPFDVASFWTRRDLAYQGSSITAGFASTSSVCGDFAYNINEDSDAIANSRNVQVHELGHNFGASHDASGGDIMATNGGNGTTWSQTSQNSINTYIEGDNGACLCQSGLGCADELAHNYDPTVQENDGSCQTCTDGIQNGPETGVDIGPTCMADLVPIACVITSASCRTIRLQNHGSIVNTVNGSVGLYLSQDPNITTSDYLVDTKSFGAVNLNPNSYQIINMCMDTDNVPEGLYYVGAIVDHQNVVPELDEDNNISCIDQTYTVGGIDGCTDPDACNYNPDANNEDTSCFNCYTTSEVATLPCDDGDPCTIDDEERILTCDGTVCWPCAGTFTDTDGDGVCDANDTCPNLDDNLIGTTCDDSDDCTINDVYNVNCECVGTFQDTDNDTVCDAEDVCPTLDDTLIGTACDDGNDCSTNDVYTANCECIGTLQDSDGDGVCDADDACPDFDDNLIGTACDDSNACTTGDTYDSNCECVGTFQDADNDTICDANDVCPNFDDTTIGTACDDGSDCTTGDVYNSNCECAGTPTDSDGDGVCDADDLCPGFDDNLIGTACDDSNDCTTGDVYNSNCECVGTFTDTDGDTICDANDVCPNFDDTTIGTACDDGDDCTINDVYTSNCECAGSPNDANGDQICQPDLVASGPCAYFGAGSLAPCVSTNVYNVGQDAGNVPFFMAIYLSEDQDITTDDYLVGTREYAPLAVGESVDITICGQPSLRANVPPGTYYYRAIIDYDNAQQESNENNNLICGNIFTYTIDPPGGCTDPNACNYDPDEDLDNGTCIDCNTAGQTSTQSCDDGDPCTFDDQQTILTCDGTICVPCAGTFTDTDNDGVCDANDICPIGDDNIDLNENLIPDACEGDTCPTINFQENPPISYGGGQDNGSVNVSNPGDVIWLENNAWKAIPLNYTVTPNTVVSFDFRSTIQGEIHGVGFDTNSSISSNYTFRVYGTQSWGNGNYDNYDGSGNYTSYTIPIGNFYTGQFQYFFFVTDHDASPRNGNSYFKDVRIYEDLNGDLLCDVDCNVGAPCNDGDVCTANDAYNADCECIGTLQDTDGDGVCDGNDVCPNFDDNLIGTACDDNDSCTENDIYTTDCECAGTFKDEDNDGTCDETDICPGFDNNLIGTACDDGNDCTLNDTYTLGCECAGTLQDADDDGVCDDDDVCPNFDDNLIGTACDDNDDCTTNDVYNSNCECAGTFSDIDNDGVCDADDLCFEFDDNLFGTPCNDNNDCTINDVYVYNNVTCACEGTLQDTDGDGVCDSEDVCPGFDDNLIGTACDDNDDCTTNDVYNSNCECEGTFADMDNDGVCDAEDVCFEFDDNLIGTPCSNGDPCTENETYNSNCECGGGTLVDTDGDGVCDAEDTCPDFDNSLIGTACNDGNDCTINDVYTFNCECAGTLADADGDGVCDGEDVCPNFDDNLIGTPCSSGDPCTENETYNSNCECGGGTLVDTDGDGVCDAEDTCPNFDNSLIGTPCNDGNDCTTNDVYTFNCECAGTAVNNCLPDLQLYLGDNISCQTATDIFGVAFHFFNIVNEGSAPSPASEIGLYISADQNFDNQDILMATIAIPPLAPGEVFDVDISGDIVAAAPGPGAYYDFTIIDHLDTVNESDEDNNFACTGAGYTIAGAGCTDPNACNYDPDATEDDGSCLDCTTIDVDNIVAQPCDDGDPCTLNDLEAVLLCNGFVCVPCAGTYSDEDADGICDTFDNCPDLDDNLIGEACDDGNSCTTNDQYINTCECVGFLVDADGDGVCDEDDICEGGDDNVDSDGDGTPDFCDPDTCVGNAFIGTPCNDNNDCTIDDIYVTNCECAGTAVNDTDGDGVCDGDDICEGGDDNLDNDNDGIPDYCDDSTCVTIDEIGDTCDDQNDCTENDVFVSYCVCLGTPINDTDGDSVCDEDDPCPDDFSDTCDLPYCEAGGTNTNYEFIQSFKLNSAFNDSGNDGGYGDYTGTSFGSVGNWNSTFEMTPGFSGSPYAEEWAIWIDYNKDGDFDDANEEIFRGTTSGTETLSTTLYLENGPGYYTRMRVAMQWNSSPQPCGTYQYGEVEDYTVFFTNVSDKLIVENGSIQVYPNPASSYVNVDLHDIISNGNVQSVQTMIYTMDGKQVYAEELDAASILTINTQHLPEASYILRLLTDDGRTFTGRFVKL